MNHLTTHPAFRPPTTRTSRSAPDFQCVLPRGTETILLVEDDPSLRGLTLHLLERCGYRVLEAEDELAALDIWDRHSDSIDLLFTDLHLCGPQSGWELARNLCAIKPGLKVIFTSGMPLEAQEEIPFTLSSFRYLSKPFQPLQLLQAIRDAFDGPESTEKVLKDIAQGY